MQWNIMGKVPNIRKLLGLIMQGSDHCCGYRAPGPGGHSSTGVQNNRTGTLLCIQEPFQTNILDSRLLLVFSRSGQMVVLVGLLLLGAHQAIAIICYTCSVCRQIMEQALLC